MPEGKEHVGGQKRGQSPSIFHGARIVLTPERDTSSIREELHWLLDRVPDADMATARKFLGSLVDPVAMFLLRAPDDDEVETSQERAVVERARQEPGPGTPHEEMLREFGL
jgi:hypothetical protein